MKQSHESKVLLKQTQRFKQEYNKQRKSKTRQKTLKKVEQYLVPMLQA